MRIVFAEVKTAGKAYQITLSKAYRGLSNHRIQHQVKHIDFFLIELGVHKPVVFGTDIRSHIRLMATFSVCLDKRLEAGMRVRNLKSMRLLAVGADIGIAQRPFHAVVADRSIANHRHPRNMFAYLEIIFQLDGLHWIVGNGSLRAEQPVLIIVRLLAVIQITAAYSRHIPYQTKFPLYLGKSVDAAVMHRIDGIYITRVFIPRVFLHVVRACRKRKRLEPVLVNGFTHQGIRLPFHLICIRRTLIVTAAERSGDIRPLRHSVSATDGESIA